MTILASDIIDNTLLKRLAHISDIAKQARQYPSSYTQWLAEHRTFSLGLGRRTLKTTTLLHYTDENTIMVVHNQRVVDDLNRQYPHRLRQIFSPYGFHHFAEQGIRGTNRTISRIFMDECDMVDTRDWEKIYGSIEMLAASRHLTDDVFILKVGTPVR
jgi:hypothetical protein